jgi:aminoglycoside/choline kinase family phosphotransferase
MNNTEPLLTPAQIEFLRNSIPSFSSEDWEIELAGRAASQRCFYRVHSHSSSYILMVWDSRDEDWPRFLGIQSDLSHCISFLPGIFTHDTRHGLILEEDLGSVTLKNFSRINCKEDVVKAYRNVLDALCVWQSIDKAASGFISARSMDLETFLWETSYFARFCVKDFCGCENLLDSAWELERARLAGEAVSLEKTYIHRDFQSENVMIHNGKVRFVDFQGARLGPPQYDTASLLFDPYIGILDDKLIDELFKYYSDKTGGGKDGYRAFYICAAQRLMQALGAYGNLSIHKGKDWYREYIPIALIRLQNVLESLGDFPAILKVVFSCRQALHC